MISSPLFADTRYDAGLEPGPRVHASGSAMLCAGDSRHEQWMKTKGAGSGGGGHTR